MTKYIHKANNKIMEVVRENEKQGTLDIKFSDGTTSVISTGTFKRWYKKIEEAVDPETLPDDQHVAEVMEQKKELGIECPAIESFTVVEEPGNALANEIANDFDASEDAESELTDDQYAQIGKEIAEQAKQKAKNAKRVSKKSEKPAKKSESTAPAVDVIAFAEEIVKKLNLEYKRSRDGLGIIVNEKRVLDLWKRSNCVRYYISSDDAKYKIISKSELITKLHDNPSKKAKLNKSFYVDLAKLTAVLTLYSGKEG